jgi:hypothetical protein
LIIVFLADARPARKKVSSIRESAYVHGFNDDDIFNAIDNRIGVLDDSTEQQERLWFVGPALNSNLVEIILVEFYDGSAHVIHARKATRTILREMGFLTGENDGHHEGR